MTERPNTTITALESGQWQLRAPLTLWQHQSGAGWVMGNHVVQVCGIGDTPEEALEDYCHNLIELAERVERQHGKLLQIMRRVNESNAPSVQKGTPGVTDCTKEEK